MSLLSFGDLECHRALERSDGWSTSEIVPSKCGCFNACHWAFENRPDMAEAIDLRLGLLKLHLPYHESDQLVVMVRGQLSLVDAYADSVLS